MSRRKKRNTDCIEECGQRGKYRYGRELSEFLNITLWTGVYVCDECYAEMEEAYANFRGTDKRWSDHERKGKET